MKLNLPAVVLEMLKHRGATRDAGLHASPERLAQTCEAHQYVPHPSVRAFEAEFGGLLIPDEPMQEQDGPSWLFGAHACLGSGAHVNPRGGGRTRKLVPVVYSPNDVIYYLDKDGRAYVQDSIEDTSAAHYADDGTSLVCRILFDDALFSRQETSLELPGLLGEALAKRHFLALVAEASGLDRRFFSDATGDMLVVEDIKARRTSLACATKEQLLLVQQSTPASAGNPSPELIPFLGKASLRMVPEQGRPLPDFFDQLPDLRELDVSSNRLEALPESLWRATQLTALDLSFNPLKSLPEGLGKMKALRSLSLRGCPFEMLPDALAGAKNLTQLNLTECEALDVDAALLLIAKLPKLKDLSLPLSRTLSSLAPLAQLPLKSLLLKGSQVPHPDRLPAGLGQLKKLTDLRITYADDIALLPEATADVQALRLLFSKRFSDADIRVSAGKQPEKLYLRAFADTL